MSTPFILLINPWIYDFAAYDLWIKPLGMLYLASILKKNNFMVHYLDCLDPYHPGMKEALQNKKVIRKNYSQGHFYREEVTKPEPLKAVKRKYKRYGISTEMFDEHLSSTPQPQVVLITSMMTYWYPGVFEVIRRVKLHYPEVPVILGGVYATLCRSHAQNFSMANAVICGAGETEILHLLHTITGKSPAFMPDPANPDSMPYPACELLSSRNALPVLTSRGCPFKCTYCASSLLTPYFYQRDPHLIADELEFWVNREGTTDFVFYDDALLVNPESHAILLFKEVIKRKLLVRFHIPNGLHVRHINQAVADLMIEAGCKTLRLGLETADAHLQKNTGDKVSTKEFIEAAQALIKAGFSSQETGVYILAGLPGQESRQVVDTMELVREHGLRPIITEYSPIPGTTLWETACAASPFPLKEEPLFHNNSILPCQWEKFTVEDLNRLKNESRKGVDMLNV